MTKTFALALVVLAGAGLSVAGTAAQQGQARPGPGSGIVTVDGEVDVRRMPPVAASQNGEWRVALASGSEVRIAGTASVAPVALPFVREGGRYLLTWDSGASESIRVVRTAGAWVLQEGGNRQRWVNLAMARSIEELP